MSDDVSSQRETLLQSLHERLETEREEFLLSIANQTANNMEAGACYGDRGAEDATEVYEQTWAMTLQLHLKGRLKAIEAALAHFAAGTYGFCENCDGPIEEARLVVLPETVLCFTCAKAVQSQRRR